MEKVIRNLGDVSVNNESRHVEGYALLFNTQSRFIGWYETISPTAITEDVIRNSDIFALFNHDMNKVLARSENGKGTLKLEVDERGLKYSFDAPKTALGDELLEHLERGDIHQSSFAFGIDFGDDEMVTREYRDEDIYYTINHIPVLYDVSPVWQPAYSETFVGKRAMEIAERMLQENTINDDMKKEEIELRSEEEKDEEVKEQETSTENNEEDEETRDENSEENTEDEDEDEKEDEQEERSEQINKNKQRKFTMKEQKFSLIKAIRAIANNQAIDEATKAVVEMGANEMRKSGLSAQGQIQIPVGMELRDDPTGITVTSVHDDIIVTDYANVLEPLHANNVCVAAGCKYLTNLVGDLQVPIMGAEQVGWSGEIANASDGTGDWSHVTLTPHRLTAYIDVSKQFLAQDALNCEQLIRQELVNALNSKLEATILSADAATATKPAGIFYGMTEKEVAAFSDITELESDVEEANILGTMKYIVSPKAKAALRNMARSADSTRLVMEGNEIDGTPALSTTHMAQNTISFGDWSSVVVGQWGAIDLIVDPYTVAISGQVRITINAYFDFKLLREDAIVYGTTDVD